MTTFSAWSSIVRRLALLAALLPFAATAGHVDGPYLLWFNLAGDDGAEHAIHAYTHAPGAPDSCWNDYAVLQARGLPDGATPDLVRRAVVLRQPAAQKKLRAILEHPKGDDVMKGYDGVVVVTSAPSSAMTSFSTQGRIVTSRAVDSDGKPAWEARFCKVLPEVCRDV